MLLDKMPINRLLERHAKRILVPFHRVLDFEGPIGVVDGDLQRPLRPDRQVELLAREVGSREKRAGIMAGERHLPVSSSADPDP
jgi:hypothetical protein